VRNELVRPQPWNIRSHVRRLRFAPARLPAELLPITLHNALLISVRVAQNNRSKSACAVSHRKRINNQAVWPVILRLTGPICAHAPKLKPRRWNLWVGFSK
jgi:hypothetical protein